MFSVAFATVPRFFEASQRNLTLQIYESGLFAAIPVNENHVH
jgi:hypothetical protein